LTAESLSEALKKATTDEKQIAKAKVVGETIRRENGVVRAIEAIYRDLVSHPLVLGGRDG
jgi:sterol 3beta-glucosyltransferase